MVYNNYLKSPVLCYLLYSTHTNLPWRYYYFIFKLYYYIFMYTLSGTRQRDEKKNQFEYFSCNSSYRSLLICFGLILFCSQMRIIITWIPFHFFHPSFVPCVHGIELESLLLLYSIQGHSSLVVLLLLLRFSKKKLNKNIFSSTVNMVQNDCLHFAYGWW